MTATTFPTIELDYQGQAQAEALFEAFANEPWSILLSSGGAKTGRYDIIVARPFMTLEGQNDGCLLHKNSQKSFIARPCFRILETLYRSIFNDSADYSSPYPFNGGAVGYFSYDLGQQTEQLAFRNKQLPTPLMAIGFYDWAIIIDHQQAYCHLVSFGLNNSTDIREIFAYVQTFSSTNKVLAPLALSQKWQAMITQAQYRDALATIKAHLVAGDSYQVNFAQCFQLTGQADPWQIFKHLNAANQAPFSAFIQQQQQAIISVSPERFLQVKNQQVETQPIKGTRPRARDPIVDQRLAQELVASEKDRAENLMIVDLMRNDLGKTCAAGSIQVPQLFELQSFAAVHHLVSTVTGKLSDPSAIMQLFEHAFPGGSITGTPKRRTMQIIDDLENINRSVYCGAIAYIDQFGQMDSNIAIRTLVYHHDTLYAWAGGGIVIDSDPDLEYQECFDKLNRILPVIAGF